MLFICYSYYIYIHTYILYILYTIYIYTFIVTRSLSIHILCIDYIYIYNIYAIHTILTINTIHISTCVVHMP